MDLITETIYTLISRKLSNCLTEALDRHSAPGVRKFWNDLRTGASEHIFSKHPILGMEGYNLAIDANEYDIEKLRELYPELVDLDADQLFQRVNQHFMNVLHNVMRVEHQHTDELQQLAIDIVSRVWGIEPGRLNAKLEPPTHEDLDTDDNFEAEAEAEEPLDTEKLDRIVHKRITLNAMIHGSAVNSMIHLHHMVDNAINHIDPNLLDLYKKLAILPVFNYWLVDIASLMAGGANPAGTVRLTDQESPESEDQAQINIEAKGAVFPVLLQELVKGVMELLALPSLSNLSHRELEYVLNKSDVLTDEQWLIQVGPHLWRKFLSIVPKGHKLAEVVAKLAEQEPDFVHNLLSQALSGENLEGAREQLNAIMQAVEEHINGDDNEYQDDVNEYDLPNDEWEPDINDWNPEDDEDW